MENVEEGESPAADPLPDLMAMVNSAAQIPDSHQRDIALVEALRVCRKELEDAEYYSEEAKDRLADAKDTFECASKILSGVPPSSLTFPVPSREWSGSRAEKRLRTSYGDDQNTVERPAGGLDFTAPEPDTVPLPIPTNPIYMPSVHTSVETEDSVISEEVISSHRELFYQKLLGVSASDVDKYAPSIRQANLRSKAQLEEGIYIVQHWDTGVDGLDPKQFRSQHKTWYSKMQPPSYSVGRRAGIHVRTLVPREGQEGEGEIVLCRYSKDGTKSLPYLSVSQLYDAMFEVHYLETNHCGIFGLKTRMDDMYANVPEIQVKPFLDTCSICREARGNQVRTFKIQGV